jgi:hypothetical protein
MIAKEKLMKIVGAGNVSYEEAILAEYSKDMSFVNTVKPVCVVKPKSDFTKDKLLGIRKHKNYQQGFKQPFIFLLPMQKSHLEKSTGGAHDREREAGDHCRT